MITTVWVRKGENRRLFPNMSAFLSTFAFDLKRDLENSHVKSEFILETLVNHLLFGEDLFIDMFAIIGIDEAVVFRGEEEEWTAIVYRDILKGSARTIERIVGDEAGTLFKQVAADETKAIEANTGGDKFQIDIQETIGKLPEDKQGRAMHLLSMLPKLLKPKS